MSQQAKQYDLGDSVRCLGVFRDLAGAFVDPSVVKISIKDPAGVITIKTFGTDAEVVKSSVGNYYRDVNANAAGRWYYRVYSTGTGQAAAEMDFIVRASNFV